MKQKYKWIIVAEYTDLSKSEFNPMYIVRRTRAEARNLVKSYKETDADLGWPSTYRIIKETV